MIPALRAPGVVLECAPKCHDLWDVGASRRRRQMRLRANLRSCEGTAMHPSTHAALALLLLLAAQGAHAQAPLPAGFVDAAAVADGLVLDMRYFGADNFVGERIDGYERPRCLLSVQAANALAAVDRDISARGLGL